MGITEMNEERIISAERIKEQFFNRKAIFRGRIESSKDQNVLDLLLRGGSFDLKKDNLY